MQQPNFSILGSMIPEIIFYSKKSSSCVPQIFMFRGTDNLMYLSYLLDELEGVDRYSIFLTTYETVCRTVNELLLGTTTDPLWVIDRGLDGSVVVP